MHELVCVCVCRGRQDGFLHHAIARLTDTYLVGVPQREAEVFEEGVGALAHLFLFGGWGGVSRG